MLALTTETGCYLSLVCQLQLTVFISNFTRSSSSKFNPHDCKQPEASARGKTLTAMVETDAILALLISILLIFAYNPN